MATACSQHSMLSAQHAASTACSQHSMAGMLSAQRDGLQVLEVATVCECLERFYCRLQGRGCQTLGRVHNR